MKGRDYKYYLPYIYLVGLIFFLISLSIAQSDSKAGCAMVCFGSIFINAVFTYPIYIITSFIAIFFTFKYLFKNNEKKSARVILLMVLFLISLVIFIINFGTLFIK